ncbi:MAG: hypothetical protein RLZZ175_1003 [Bacteroidota bacterium]|jgi:asparagine synthase (glutamine-hydrolysing)
MCGILFAIDKTDSQIEFGLSMLSHRGPDYQSFCRKNQLVLGHTLLSIMNSIVDAKQPYVDSQTENVLAWNGEIYNLNLLTEKYFYNQTFKTDTEQLHALLSLKSNKVLSELNGMFSIFFYNKKLNNVLIARDKHGIKPLYYHVDKQIFASEIKPIQCLTSKTFTVSQTSFQQYLSFGYSSNNNTFWNEVKSFPKGHFQFYSLHNNTFTEPQSYVENYNFQSTYLSENYLQELIINAVNEQSKAETKVGLMLSGGVDSSILLAASKSKITSFVVNQDGLDNSVFESDLKYATLVAKHFDSKLIEVDAPITENLPQQLAHILEEPIADIAAWYQYKIGEKAKNEGIKVLLSGTGADELFAGYRRHKAFEFSQNSVNHLLVNFTSPFKKLFSSEIQKLIQFNTSQNINELIYLGKMAQLFPQKQNKVKNLQELLQFEQDNYLVYNNLLVNDKSTMAFGIEVRVPYLDNSIEDFAHQLSKNQLIDKNIQKVILKNAFKNQLPKEILNRPKSGMAGIPSVKVTNYWKQFVIENKQVLFDNIEIEKSIFEKTFFSNSLNYKELMVFVMSIALIQKATHC